MNRVQYPQEFYDTIRLGYWAGRPVAVIAKDLAVSPWIVHYHARSMGLLHPNRRSTRQLPAETIEQMRLRRAEGATFTELAAAFGVGRETVRRLIEAALIVNSVQQASEQKRERRDAEILARASRGERQRQIARAMGLTPGIVGGVLYRAGTVSGKCGGPTAGEAADAPGMALPPPVLHSVTSFRQHAPIVTATRKGCLDVEIGPDGTVSHCGARRKKGSNLCPAHHWYYLAPASVEAAADAR